MYVARPFKVARRGSAARHKMSKQSQGKGRSSRRITILFSLPWREGVKGRGRIMLGQVFRPVPMSLSSKKDYPRRIAKISTTVTITNTAPPPITTHAHSGVAGCAGGNAGAGPGAAIVWRLKVALQSLGAGSTVITRQK